MADALTIAEYGVLRTCIRADRTHSRTATLAIVESCVLYMNKEDGLRRTMESLAGKLSVMSDAEFAAASAAWKGG